MTPRFKNVTPHQDVRDGILDESEFAVPSSLSENYSQIFSSFVQPLINNKI